METILSHASLIDCVEPKVRPDTAVLIEDGRIRAILSSGEAGSAGDARQRRGSAQPEEPRFAQLMSLPL
jgi:hypothetical protein